MNLIRNILLSVVLIQFLGFLYYKFFYEKKQSSIPPQHTENRQQILVLHKKNLPTSTQYSDSKAPPQIKSIKIANLSSVTQPIIAKATIPKKVKKLKRIKKIKLVKKIKKLKKVKITKKIKKPTPKAIHKVYIKRNKKIKLTNKVEKYAKKMLGKKYVWGATGPKTYDCSGFTQKVYRKVAGIKLPRVSYLQAKVGKKISFKHLKQGDMVFFDTEKKRTGKVNHVGIYLTKGNFIHASSGSKKVVITNFRKKRFYKNRFLWGRRVIKDSRGIALLPTNTKKTL